MQPQTNKSDYGRDFHLRQTAQKLSCFLDVVLIVSSCNMAPHDSAWPEHVKSQIVRLHKDRREYRSICRLLNVSQNTVAAEGGAGRVDRAIAEGTVDVLKK